MTNIIDKAADRLRGRWHQGWMGDTRGDGSVCLIGALCVAAEVSRASDIPHNVKKALRAELGHVDLVGFNDNPSTSEETVLLLMKKASARLDEAS